jgi:hypothetical protein
MRLRASTNGYIVILDTQALMIFAIEAQVYLTPLLDSPDLPFLVKTAVFFIICFVLQYGLIGVILKSLSSG